MTSSPPSCRDPYSLDNIMSPPISSAKSAQEPRSGKLFHSHALARAAASSPLAAISANALAKKRQRSPDLSDDLGFFAPKRQNVSSVLNPESRAVEREKPTWTQPQPAMSSSSPIPFERASGKRDSGFHEDQQDEDITGNKEVAMPALHDDSGFHEPADDESHVKNNGLAMPSLDEQVKSVVVGSPVPVADMAISVDDTEDADVEEDASSVEGDHVEERHSDHDPSIQVAEVVNGEATIEAVDLAEEPTIEAATPAEEATIEAASPAEAASEAKNKSVPGRRRGRQNNNKQVIVYSNILDQTPDANADADDNDDEEAKEYPVDHVSSHRLTPDGLIELLVQWEDPDEASTWEPEDQLQLGARDAVAAYWATVEGGRLSVRPYEVFAVRGHEWVKTRLPARRGKASVRAKHTVNKLCLRVEWLGYVEETLEPVDRFKKDQPVLVEQYFELLGGRPRPRP